MSDPAAILATSGAVRTLVDGTLRLTVDVDPKDAQVAFALFGKPGSPVALARITNEAAVAHDRPKPAEPTDRKPLSLASKVALTIADPEFHLFLSDPRGVFVEEWNSSAGLSEDADTAEGMVKRWCGVDRKRDIEGDTHAMMRWRQMYRAFQNWCGSKALAERTGAAA